MSWLSDLAGKAETLLNSLDEQTGEAVRNHKKTKTDKKDTQSMSCQYRSGTPPRLNSRSTKRVLDNRAAPIKSQRSSPVRSKSEKVQIESRVSTRFSKSPVRSVQPKSNQNAPKSVIGDAVIRQSEPHSSYKINTKQIKSILPCEFKPQFNEDWTYKLQNLEVENVMLKNELNVVNKEVSELLERINKMENGNDVVRNEELSNNYLKAGKSKLESHNMEFDKEHLLMQMEKLTQKINDMMKSIEDQQHTKSSRDSEIMLLRTSRTELEEKLRTLSREREETEREYAKLERELRTTQNMMSNLQSNLEKSDHECQKMEKDWETYKLRVKAILISKDAEIKSLKEGVNLTEDTKLLIEQLNNLKEERDILSDAIKKLRHEFESMNQNVPQLEARHAAAERLIDALREALRDERGVRYQVEEKHCAALKELRSLQGETSQTIASLRLKLLEKENQLAQFKESATTVKTTETETLNLADYDSIQEQKKQVEQLTQTLVQKQATVDKLLVENNTLKIVLDKLENKYKTELSHRPNAHSVISVQTIDSRQKRIINGSFLHKVSYRISLAMKRYPTFGAFALFYMVCLHFWVVAVLFSHTPDNYARRFTKS